MTLFLKACDFRKRALLNFSGWISLLSALLLQTILVVLGASQAEAEAAFALGRDSAGNMWYGLSFNEESPATSINLAMARCQQRGPGCQLVRQFKLGCFAFAAPDIGNAAGIATGAKQGEAETRALAFCREYSRGRFCTIRQSFCDAIDGPLAQVANQRKETEAIARRNDITARQGSSCSLSAKAISYAHRVCVNGDCDAKFGVIELVGRNILQYAGGRAQDSGIQYELGRTNDVTGDLLAIRKLLGGDVSRTSAAAPGTLYRELATASFDGQNLTLYLTDLTIARSHRFLPDNTLLGLLMTTTKFRIDACKACAVTEFKIIGYTTSGQVPLPPSFNAKITEQSCAVDSMR